METTTEKSRDAPATTGKGSKVKPLSLGIISDPPTLVLCYEKAVRVERDLDGRKGPFDIDQIGPGASGGPSEIKIKRRKRKMPVRNFTDRSNVTRITFALRQRHEEYLRNVLTVTIEKMLRVIQEIQKGLVLDDAVAKVNKEYELNPEEDLNKLTTEELFRKKAIMDENFRENLLRPEDPGYVYDKVEEFVKDEGDLKPCEWDDEEDEGNSQKGKVKNGDDKPSTNLSTVFTKDKQEDGTNDVKMEEINEVVDSQQDKSDRNRSTKDKMDELVLSNLEEKDDKTKMKDMKAFGNMDQRQSDSEEGLDEILELDIETGIDLKLDDDDDFWS